MSEDKPYVMPEVYLGQPVVWYAAIGSEGAAATVTAIGTRHVTLAVWPPGYATAHTPDGALHVSDPLNSKQLENDGGVWDYTEPMRTRLQQAAITSKGKTAS